MSNKPIIYKFIYGKQKNQMDRQDKGSSENSAQRDKPVKL